MPQIEIKATVAGSRPMKAYGGVRIGYGSVIGAGSVVSRDVPPMVVAVGAPCRVLRPVTEADLTTRTA